MRPRPPLLSEVLGLHRSREAASAEDLRSLKEAVASCLGAVESRLAALGIPIVRGAFLNEDCAQIVEIAALDWSLLAQLLVPGSICVVDLQPLPCLLTEDGDARNLFVYFRQSTSGTWIKHSVMLAGSQAATESDELDDDEDDGDDEPELSQEELIRLAVRVARGEGFGSLKTRADRSEFACHVLADEPNFRAHGLYSWKVAALADGYFRTGVAPMRAKQLQSEGKSVAEIAREMGLPRQRVQTALETATPLNVAALLRD